MKRSARLTVPLEELARAEQWMLAAKCRGEQAWFCGHPERQEQAKIMCYSCPVVQECARYGLRVRLHDVVFAGTTEADRERMRRGSGRAWRLWAGQWDPDRVPA